MRTRLRPSAKLIRNTRKVFFFFAIMPKRKSNDKIERYQRKIRRLEDKERRRRQRIIESDTSDGENNSG